MSGLLISFALLVPGIVAAETVDAGSPPQWCARELKRQGLHDRLEIHRGVSPCYQRGDFDGDGRIDCAVIVQDRKTKEIGVLVLHRRGGKPHILGAGEEFGSGGADWQWLGAWSLVAGERVPERRAEGRDALHVQKAASASAYVYWDGSKYVWRQAGE